MPHQIDYSQADGLIVVRRYGDIDIDDMRKSLKGVMEISVTEGVNSALIDTRDVSSFPAVEEIYSFSVNLPEDIKFAIVLPLPDEHQRKNISQLEQIFEVQESVNMLGKISRGRDKSVGVFDDYNEAKAWLVNGTNISDFNT